MKKNAIFEGTDGVVVALIIAFSMTGVLAIVFLVVNLSISLSLSLSLSLSRSDKIKHEKLFQSMSNKGIGGKFYRFLKLSYANHVSAVKTENYRLFQLQYWNKTRRCM